MYPLSPSLINAPLKTPTSCSFSRKFYAFFLQCQMLSSWCFCPLKFATRKTLINHQFLEIIKTFPDDIDLFYDDFIFIRLQTGKWRPWRRLKVVVNLKAQITKKAVTRATGGWSPADNNISLEKSVCLHKQLWSFAYKQLLN